ncbi:protein phosphatase 1 regulatory subunit 15B [Limanda limanda]|uniref:protein phosphatase 1 regulatory subunit 15B n=1 Tax=Limanda limanda TaxID=27771 RepID=UPI0029C982FC|nr:protein phosphatase 1 regulatory subunit 15B [Limanda limanda]
MLRSGTEDGHVSSGQSSSSRAGRGVSSGGLVPQESPWIGLFSVVSRPALCFVQRFLPGRVPVPADEGPRGTGSGTGTGSASQIRFTEEGGDFFKQLEHVTQHAAAQLTDTWCQQGPGPGGPLGPGPGSGPGSAPPWLTAAALRDLGIEDPGELSLGPPTRVGGVSSVRTFLNPVLMNPVLMNPVLMNPVSAQEVKPTWWGSLWGGEDISQRALSWTEDQTPPPPAGSPPPPAGSPPPPAEDWTVREPSGAAEHKEGGPDSEGLHTIQNPGGATAELSSPGGGACSEPLTPEQDHGYSSLEEELLLLKNSSDETGTCETPMQDQRSEGTSETPMQDQRSEGTSETPMQDQRSEGTSETTDEDRPPHSADEGPAVDNMAPAGPPECQNKAIAFIMGCPCSDEEDSSQSESSEEEEEDDGFDSEGSSDLSDSTDEEEEESDGEGDGEGDSESERLWNALCQSVDPYNPRSFSAQLHSTPPRPVPTATRTATPPSPPASSPPSGLDVWDDSASASEADEVESLRLLSSFSCSSDPYSPLNFQAPIRTTGTHKVGPEAKRAPRTPPGPPHHKAASPPEYRKEEAEERLDSGFSEPPAPPPSSSTSQSAASTKKVRFCERVEEIFLGGGEDRRGPWEQLARDRGRFLRRCQEAEQSIGFCLQPQHRRLVVLRGQGTPPTQEEDAPGRISH